MRMCFSSASISRERASERMLVIPCQLYENYCPILQSATVIVLASKALIAGTCGASCVEGCPASAWTTRTFRVLCDQVAGNKHLDTRNRSLPYAAYQDRQHVSRRQGAAAHPSLPIEATAKKITAKME